MALHGSDIDKLHELCGQKTYKEQAIWFLNSFWGQMEGEAEVLWNYVDKCNELDAENHEEGKGLDEMSAHVFLERFEETQTVREMRAALRSTGAIGEKERPKAVPLTHWLLFKYKVDWHYLVNASQGDNKEEIEKAQRLLEEVVAAFDACRARAAEASEAIIEAAKSEQESLAAAEESRVREQESIAARSELEKALADLKAQEDAYHAKTETLKKKSEEGGVVSRNRAKNELAQHLAEDPLPLRRAKITAEAAVKKADRAAKASAEAVVVAEAAAAEAAADKAAAEEAKVAADAAVEEASSRVAEAEAFVEEVKQKPGQAMGALWWIDRAIHEQKKYLPESKGGIRR